MTQTLASWGGQLRPLSQTRRTLAYEARGQGETELSVDDVSFGRHAADFVALLDALQIHEPVDLCGFSFGGRTALAIAGAHPDRVRRLVLSGVGLGRSAVGQAIVRGWIATLATGDLEALARVSLADTVGAAYLTQHAHLVEPMVRAVCERNSYAGIRALFEQTLGSDDPRDSVEAHVAAVRARALVLGGAEDRLADPQRVAALAGALSAEHIILPGVGHTIPIEAATTWREAVVHFLDEGDD
jgi:pimeloyl-ACP methyl ester carboxylesterase